MTISLHLLSLKLQKISGNVHLVTVSLQILNLNLQIVIVYKYNFVFNRYKNCSSRALPLFYNEVILA